MSRWLSTLVGRISAVTLTGWILIGLLVVLALALTLLLKKRSSVKWTILVWLLAVGCIAVVLFFAVPVITIEEGANTQANFLYNPVFWAILFCIGGLLAMFLLLRKQKFTARMLSTGALCVALAFILSCITVYRLPQGGSITPVSMLPIFVFAYLYGAGPGIAAGSVYGVLQLIQGAYVVHPVQFLLDYIFPFAVLGIAGLFNKEKQFPLGVVLGCFLRFCIHVLSGVVFFSLYTPPGQSVLAYSLLYNGSYMLPETILCLVVALILVYSHTLSRLKVQRV
jgi:thiamine transporter